MKLILKLVPGASFTCDKTIGPLVDSDLLLMMVADSNGRT